MSELRPAKAIVSRSQRSGDLSVRTRVTRDKISYAYLENITLIFHSIAFIDDDIICLIGRKIMN